MKNEKYKKIQNLKERLIKFFKDPKEVVSFFLPIIITISLIIPMPFYIKMGGGTINLNKEISVEGEKKEYLGTEGQRIGSPLSRNNF